MLAYVTLVPDYTSQRGISYYILLANFNDMAQTYNHKEKTPRPTTTKTVLDPWAQIAIVPGKQTASV